MLWICPRAAPINLRQDRCRAHTAPKVPASPAGMHGGDLGSPETRWLRASPPPSQQAYTFGTTMAGHSQFKNIMHRKGRQDAARAKVFAKLAREITVSAKTGLPDPEMNARLRLAIQAARAENMPKDNIERAIKKASGADTESYEAIRYEGYGPGGVAVIAEALTNNRNRTGGAIRAVFTKHGGNLGATGAVSHMFQHVGEIVYPTSAGTADAVLEAAIEAGADDVKSQADGHLVSCAFEDLAAES